MLPLSHPGPLADVCKPRRLLPDPGWKRRTTFHYTLRKRKVVFERAITREHRKAKKTLFRFLRETRILVSLTAPVIYAALIPLAFLDLFVTFYQYVCFPIYGIETVPRRRYVVIDRHRLAYLNAIEKLNCAYCGYGNGVAAYAREVIARTEKYWCPIKHADRTHTPHHLYYDFLEYGDADGYRTLMEERLRKARSTPKT